MHARRLFHSLLLISLFAISGQASAAVRVYRCNGKVQQYPCHLELFKRQIKPETSVAKTTQIARVATQSKIQEPRYQLAPGKVVAGRHFAKILSQKFRRVNSAEGHWQGQVEGNGRVQLQLEWFQHGAPRHSVSIGSVTLQNRSTSFGFRTACPAGGGWTWKISAIATEA
jgi:hypothetical protein